MTTRINKFILQDGSIFPFPSAEDRLDFVKSFSKIFPETDSIDLPSMAFERALPYLRDFELEEKRVLLDLRRDTTLFGDTLLTAHCLEYHKMVKTLTKIFKLSHEYDTDAELRLSLFRY